MCATWEFYVTVATLSTNWRLQRNGHLTDPGHNGVRRNCVPLIYSKYSPSQRFHAALTKVRGRAEDKYGRESKAVLSIEVENIVKGGKCALKTTFSGESYSEHESTSHKYAYFTSKRSKRDTLCFSSCFGLPVGRGRRQRWLCSLNFSDEVHLRKRYSIFTRSPWSCNSVKWSDDARQFKHIYPGHS